MPATITLLASAVIDEQVIGGQPGGWFLTYDDATDEIHLRAADDPGTVVDTKDFGYPLVRPSGTRAAGVQASDADQRLFVLADPGDPADFEIIELFVDTGDVIQDILVGTVPRATYARQYASADGLEYLLIGSGGDTTVYAYSTSDGSAAWSFDYSATTLGIIPTAYPAAGLALAYSGTSFALMDETGADLDTLAYSTTGALVMGQLGSRGIAAVDMDDDETTLRTALLDCRRDLLALGAWTETATGWGADVARVGTDGTTTIVGPGTSLGSPYDALSLAWSVPPDVSLGSASTLVGPGADVLVMAGPSVAVLAPFVAGTNALSTWTVTVAPVVGAPAILRQRQSPRYSPSRVMR